MTIKILFKSGAVHVMECDSITIHRNPLNPNDLSGYEMEGITKNKPLYICLDEVAGIFREGKCD